MASIRRGTIVGALLTAVIIPGVARAAAAGPCQPECGAGQVCVDGACAPASDAAAGASAEGTPKLAAPAPARAGAAAAPLWREGFLVLPSLGINSFQGDSGAHTGVGARAGILLGSRLGENWSLNFGIVFDDVNADGTAGASVTSYILDLGIHPLIHFPLEKLEIIAGPILGTFAQYGNTSGLGVTVDNWSYGWTVGANAGLLFPVSARAKIGGLLNFLLREPSKVCASVGGGPSSCASNDLNSAKTLALALAAMF